MCDARVANQTGLSASMNVVSRPNRSASSAPIARTPKVSVAWWPPARYVMPSSCAWARESSSGSPEMKAWSPSAAASGRVRAGAARADADAADLRRPAEEQLDGLAGELAEGEGERLGGGGSGSVPWTASGAPRLSANQPSTCSPRLGGDAGVVAERGVGVEREVVGGEADVVVEQHLQPPPEHGVDEQRPGAPEQPVVDDQQLGPDGGGACERLERRRDRGATS